MSILSITPRQYKSSLKWSLIPSNKIDTVSMQPIENTLAAEQDIVHTERFTQVTVEGISGTSLPIADGTVPTHWRHVHNEYYAQLGDREFAKARVECIMATGESTFTIDKVIPGLPEVSIRLNGKSYVISRGDSTYDTYPSYSNLKNKSFDVSSWIKSRATHEYDYLQWDYNDSVFSMNPFVKNWTSEDIKWGEAIPTTAADILTTWWQYSSTKLNAAYNGWSEYTSFGSNNQKKAMYPVGAEGGDLGALLNTRINIYDQQLDMYVNIQKLSDYVYKVSWKAPVRFTYVAATRQRGAIAGFNDLDNFAFVDEVSQVEINVNGRVLSENSVDINYSLTNAGALTEDPSNKHPFKIDKVECLTLGTTYNGQIWTSYIADALLSKYRDGKYTVTCEINATWALQHNIGINSQVYIYLQDGQPISRGPTNSCVFEVKNIEKRFSSNEFVFALQLMEI